MNHVVVIDDEQDNLDVLELCLLEDFNVTAINNGPEGFDYIKQNANNIDLIILDKMMPKKDGLSILNDVRRTAKLQHIPVIIQSGDDKQESIDKAIEMGANAYLTKPFKPDDLVKLAKDTISQNS